MGTSASGWAAASATSVQAQGERGRSEGSGVVVLARRYRRRLTPHPHRSVGQSSPDGGRVTEEAEQLDGERAAIGIAPGELGRAGRDDLAGRVAVERDEVSPAARVGEGVERTEQSLGHGRFYNDAESWGSAPRRVEHEAWPQAPSDGARGPVRS